MGTTGPSSPRVLRFLKTEKRTKKSVRVDACLIRVRPHTTQQNNSVPFIQNLTVTSEGDKPKWNRWNRYNESCPEKSGPASDILDWSS